MADLTRQAVQVLLERVTEHTKEEQKQIAEKLDEDLESIEGTFSARMMDAFFGQEIWKLPKRM